MLLAGVITLMDELYYKLAVWLNDQGLLLNYICKTFPINIYKLSIDNFISPMQLENCLSDEILNMKEKKGASFSLTQITLRVLFLVLILRLHSLFMSFLKN